MQVILSDHNCEGQAKAIVDVLIRQETWLELAPLQLQWFRHVNLPISANDEAVWQFCQTHRYLLLTGNRSTDDGGKSLEFTARRLITSTSLPVLTIGNLKRVPADPLYREQCVYRLANIVADLDRYLGVMRLFLP